MGHALHLGIYIGHHRMKLIGMINTHFRNRIDVAVVHIKVCSNREVNGIPFTAAPVKYGRIYLHCKYGEY